jgi:hypothetical protein
MCHLNFLFKSIGDSLVSLFEPFKIVTRNLGDLHLFENEQKNRTDRTKLMIQMKKQYPSAYKIAKSI